MHVDPGTPTGQEYALPVEQARQDASHSAGAPGKRSGTTSTRSDTTSTSAPLFGAGVTPDARRPKPADTATPRTTDASKSRTTTSESVGRAPAPRRRVVLEQTTDSSGVGGTAVMIAAGAAMIVLVGLGGFAARALRPVRR